MRRKEIPLQFNVAITLKEIYVRKETHITIVGQCIIEEKDPRML
jgi:hypothetical protein